MKSPLKRAGRPVLKLLSVAIVAGNEEGCIAATVVRPLRDTGVNGFRRAITFGFDHSHGDALVVMMADESEDCSDVVKYRQLPDQGCGAVIGSLCMKGLSVLDYPTHEPLYQPPRRSFLAFSVQRLQAKLARGRGMPVAPTS
jgi:hypothetical protein